MAEREIYLHNTTLKIMIEAAVSAGDIIMEFYQHPITFSEKRDGTPVTLADKKAEASIIDALSETGIPILGEECVADGIIPDICGTYFCVDALDGTKEFIKRNGQFTVNIALIEEGIPVLGVIFVPVEGALYTGEPDGAYKYDVKNGKVDMRRAISTNTTQGTTIITSVSHAHAGIDMLAQALTIKKIIRVGSSLKLCMLARGDAQIYPRFAPTCFWDIAAGHAILKAAGGVVLNLNAESMTYPDDKSNFLNSRFVAAANQALALKTLEQMNKLSI